MDSQRAGGIFRLARGAYPHRLLSVAESALEKAGSVPAMGAKFLLGQAYGINQVVQLLELEGG